MFSAVVLGASSASHLISWFPLRSRPIDRDRAGQVLMAISLSCIQHTTTTMATITILSPHGSYSVSLLLASRLPPFSLCQCSSPLTGGHSLSGQHYRLVIDIFRKGAVMSFVIVDLGLIGALWILWLGAPLFP